MGVSTSRKAEVQTTRPAVGLAGGDLCCMPHLSSFPLFPAPLYALKSQRQNATHTSLLTHSTDWRKWSPMGIKKIILLYNTEAKCLVFSGLQLWDSSRLCSGLLSVELDYLQWGLIVLIYCQREQRGELPERPETLTVCVCYELLCVS